jgi:primosomal protein N''
MQHAEQITLSQFAAMADYVHTCTVRRWTLKDPSCPQPRRKANGHLAFDRREVERYLKRRRAPKQKRAA